MVVRACVAQRVTVISLAGSGRLPVEPGGLVGDRPAQPGMPGHRGYWLCPLTHGLGHGVHRAGVAIKVREALTQVDGLMLWAKADITEKMVVPTWAAWLAKVRPMDSKAVVFAVQREGTLDHVARKPVGELFGELVPKWRR